MVKEQEDKAIVAASRASDLPERSRVRGSMPAPCVECEEIVWLSPASQDKVREGASAMCLQCVSARIRKDGGVVVAPLSERQRREVAGHLERGPGDPIGRA